METKIWLIDENNSVEEQISVSKLRLEYADGSKVTIEFGSPRTPEEIVIRGYYGDEEYDPTPQTVALNILPGAVNLIAVRPELLDSNATK